SPFRSFRCGYAGKRDGAFAAGDRSAWRLGTWRIPEFLSANCVFGFRADCRLRSPASLAASNPRIDWPGRIYSCGRRNRADPRVGVVEFTGSLSSNESVEKRSKIPRLGHQREPVCEAISTAPSSRGHPKTTV